MHDKEAVSKRGSLFYFRSFKAQNQRLKKACLAGTNIAGIALWRSWEAV
jgi:hypothetical protein